MGFADQERQTRSSSFASRVIHIITTPDNICLALRFYLCGLNLWDSLFSLFSHTL